MRHAAAKSKDEDPERSLSDIGIMEATRMADFVKQNQSVQVKVILHSGKLRAHQTADIVASRLNPKPRVMEANNLDPDADTAVWIERAMTMEENVMLVGHLPHLGNLTACLLYQDENRHSVDFVAAALVCLERGSDGTWQLDWIVTPQIV